MGGDPLNVDPASPFAVALAQRVWLSKLQVVEPDRPILAQRVKTDTWEPWRSYAPTDVFWTRRILRCELIADADTPEKLTNRLIINKWCTGARKLSAMPLGPVDSGGRGWHAHVFVDFDALMFDAALLRSIDKRGIEASSLIREKLFDEICKAGALSPIEVDALDATKVRWSIDRMGSMVRDFGSVGGRGYPKTLGTPGTLVFPDELPILWDATAHVPLLETELKARVETAKLRAKEEKKASKKRATSSPGEAESKFAAHACVKQALTTGPAPGERKKAALQMARIARDEGLTEAECRAQLSAMFALCGLDKEEDPERFVRYAYDDASRKAAYCGALSSCQRAAACPAFKGPAFTLGGAPPKRH